MRELVTIRRIDDIREINGADKIELAVVGGWQCIVKKGEFEINGSGLFHEIDSLVPAPTDPRYEFMASRKSRVKTMKMRGELSQGLLMPLSMLTDEERARIDAGESPAEVLGVTKWEPPLPGEFRGCAGDQAGPFPGFLQKTDQERAQNLKAAIEGRHLSDFEVTEKLDGTSFTAFYYQHPDEKEPRIGVCSRNWEMKLDDENVYAAIAKKYDILEKLKQLGKNIAIQGEIIGPKIQNNKYKLEDRKLYVFDIYSIDRGGYLPPFLRQMVILVLGLDHVPILRLPDRPLDVGTVLDLADGRSMLADVKREGLVLKAYGDNFRFKAISNDWLLTHGG